MSTYFFMKQSQYPQKEGVIWWLKELEDFQTDVGNKSLVSTDENKLYLTASKGSMQDGLSCYQGFFFSFAQALK